MLPVHKKSNEGCHPSAWANQNERHGKVSRGVEVQVGSRVDANLSNETSVRKFHTDVCMQLKLN